jgi:hypothetical protein
MTERLAREHERFANLDRMRYIFDAYFGKEAAKPFEVVDEIYADIVSSAETLIQIASANPTRQDREDEMPLRNILGWGSRKRPDEIDVKLDNCLKNIEQTCRPILAERISKR